jgi:exonuclease VII small subunit
MPKKSEGMTLNIARDKIYEINKDFEKITKELNAIVSFLEERGNQIENQQDIEIMQAAIASLREVSQSLKSAEQWVDFLCQYGPTSD